MKSIRHNEVQLAKAIKELLIAWDQSGQHWHDRARTAYEKEYIVPFVSAARGGVQSIAEVNRLLEDAIRECS